MNLFEKEYAVLLGKGLIDDSEYKLATESTIVFEYAEDYFMSKERAEKLAKDTGGKVVRLKLEEL